MLYLNHPKIDQMELSLKFRQVKCVKILPKKYTPLCYNHYFQKNYKQKNEKKYSLGRVTGHNGVAASFFPAHLSSIQFARAVLFGPRTHLHPAKANIQNVRCRRGCNVRLVLHEHTAKRFEQV